MKDSWVLYPANDSIFSVGSLKDSFERDAYSGFSTCLYFYVMLMSHTSGDWNSYSVMEILLWQMVLSNGMYNTAEQMNFIGYVQKVKRLCLNHGMAKISIVTSWSCHDLN